MNSTVFISDDWGTRSVEVDIAQDSFPLIYFSIALGVGEKCSPYDQAVYTNVLSNTLFGGIIQLSDNYLVFQRYNIIIGKTSALHKYSAISWVFLFMILTWAPFFTILPIWYDLNSEYWIYIQTIISVWILFLGVIFYEMFYLILVCRQLVILRNSTVAETTSPSSHRKFIIEIALRAILHSIMGITATMMYVFYPPNGVIWYSLFVSVGIHLFLNVKFKLKSLLDFKETIRKGLKDSYGLLQLPLVRLAVLSALFFLPLSLSFSALDTTELKDTNIIPPAQLILTFSCTLSITVPLLIDGALDAMQNSRAPFFEYRMLSTLNLAVTSGVILGELYTSKRYIVIITMFTWSFFIEFGVIFILLAAINPSSTYSTPLTLTSTGLMFIFLYATLLSSTNEYAGSALLALALASFILFAVLAVTSSMFWFRKLYKLCIRSAKFKLKDNMKYTNVLLARLFIYIISIFVLFGSHKQECCIFDSFNIRGIIVLRTCVFIFAYLIPARLYRNQLFKSSIDSAIKTELIKYVSHEIRSPISAISVGLELIEKSVAGATNQQAEGIRDNLRDLKESCLQSVSILDNMLLYERIENDTLKPQFSSEIPLAGILKILNSYTLMANRVDLSISIQYSTDDFTSASNRIHIDKSLLKMVFDSIWHPALRAESRQGNLTVRIGVKDAKSLHDEIQGKYSLDLDASIYSQHSAIEQQYRHESIHNMRLQPSLVLNRAQLLYIEIKDFRGDIHKEDIKQMMKNRLDFTRKGHGDGMSSGLKLWLAKQIMTKHDGDISVQKRTNPRCTIFNLYLPLRNASNYEIDVSSISLVASDPEQAVNASAQVTIYNVLVVDDSLLVRKMVTKLMLSLGHQCMDVDDGDAAVEIIRNNKSNKIDLILMDNEMKRMNGSVAADIIRNEFHFRGIIIGVTGNASVADIEEFRSKGVDDVIIKPLTSLNLAESIGKVKPRLRADGGLFLT